MPIPVRPARKLENRLSRLCTAVLVGAAMLPGLAAGASLDVYISAPGEQSTYLAGATTETFNTLPLGIQTSPYNSSVGTYQFGNDSTFAVLNADQYGGASNSQYVALGSQSQSSAPVTLSLTAPATYFGFWWSAGDANNGLSFYADNTLLTRITTADIIHLLESSGGSVTAVNGSTYTSGSYFGNPNNGYDGGEPFAYVDIFARGTAFNKIVFDNSGTTGTGFETDNHSVFSGVAEPNGPSVFIESLPASITTTPEPTEILLTGLGLVVSGFVFRRRK